MKPPAGRVNPPGAFTLFELIVALTLAVALAAVVLPVSMSWLAAAGLDEAPARVETALALARADAQRRGVVVEVVAVEMQDGVTELRSRDVTMEDDAIDEPLEPERREAILGELPAGTKLRRGGSEEGDGFAAGDDVFGMDPAAEPAPAEIVLALALPDGRIVAEGGGELRAVGNDGRWAVLGINGWTGEVSSRPGVEVMGAIEDLPPEDPAEAM